MTKNVLTVGMDEPLSSARELIRKHHIRHLPVVQGQQLVGIISRTDLNRLSFNALFSGDELNDDSVVEMLTISQVMSHKPRVVKETETIKHVAEILSEEEFHALPVVSDDQSRLTGIVTTTDVIKYMLEQY